MARGDLESLTDIYLCRLLRITSQCSALETEGEKLVLTCSSLDSRMAFFDK